ncbi:MAG: hypothetical protein RL616_555 [Verrucomicrobiota bacterium]
MKTKIYSLLLAAGCAAVTTTASAQTYRITDLGTIGTNASVATGINASGQVSGYSASGASTARAWRFTPGVGLVDLGSFGGADNRALGINNAGQVTGFSTDTNGVTHGFVFNGAFTDIGGSGNVYPQHLNSAGKVAGFSTDTNGNDTAFQFSPPNTFSNLGLIANAALPASSAAYDVNDSGVVVGIGTGSNNFSRAFRSTTNGALEELGTLGGDESWAYAINNLSQIVGTADFVSGDTHAFLFNDGEGMADLGTLGGYTSTAFALDNSGNAVGAAEIVNRTLHATLWPSSDAARDLNELIPINSGWVLTEARGVNDAGQIVGSGLLNGQPRAFLLTPNSGADTNPPVALLAANNITNLQYSVQFFQITFSDDTAVLGASLATNCVRVTGPNGFNQIATLYPYSIVPPYQLLSTASAVKLAANFYVTNASLPWNGTNNGVYSVAIEPNTVSDTSGNFMPAASIGTFTVATETKPVVSISGALNPVMNLPATFTLAGLSSFPYLPTDVFNFTIDWSDDGSDVQHINATNGAPVVHTYTSIGYHTIRVSATDVHGVASLSAIAIVNVINPVFPQISSTAPALTGSRRLAVGLNQSGTLLCLGGLPVKGGKDVVNTLAPGAAIFTDAQRLPAATIGVGAGIGSSNHIIVFGGIEPNAATANVNGYVYTTGGGAGAAIANKNFAAYNFAFATDNLHRLYSIGGAGTTNAANAVERYDANSNSWATLAPMPAGRIGATASYDGHGHIIVIGGTDATNGSPTLSVFSYDIASNAWMQMADAPISTQVGRVAQLGADNLIYLIGGANGALVYVYDSIADSWFNGPFLSLTRSQPAVALGDDGFIYVMGGDNVANGNNGLATTEKFDTSSTNAPQIVSAQYPFGGTVQALSTFSYKVIAFGNPRPVLSLVSGPAGMNFNPANGQMTWTPTTNQVGTSSVLFRATSSAGVAEQTFTITVTPIPPPVGDITPPTAPTTFNQVFRSATSVTVTWSGATDDVGVAKYNFYVLTGSRSRHWALFGSTTNHSSYIANGFTPGAIAAVDAAGNVSPLHLGYNSVLTLPAISPLASTVFPSVIQGNAFLTTISVSGTPNAAFSTLTGPAGMSFTHVAGANTNADYVVVQWQPGAQFVGTNTFTANATNANTSGSSTTFKVVVLPNGTDTIAPTPVAQMTASGISFDHCNLNWTPAGDNIGVVNYHLVATHFGATSNHLVTLNVNGANTNTVLSGLLANAGYTVVITPSDAAGNVGSSTSIFLTTLVQPNVALKISNGQTPGTLALNWNGYGAQWKFTVESSDSLVAPNWTAVAPANVATNLVVTPSSAMKFFRINSTPAQ